MNRKILFLLIICFFILTLILIIIRINNISKNRYEEDREQISAVGFRNQEQKPAEPDPVVNIPDINTTGEPIPFRNKVKDIIRGIRPLPVFPSENRVILYQRREENENMILENLYKETNTDYIQKEEQGVSNRVKLFKQEYDSGIKQ